MTTPLERMKAAWESPDRVAQLNRVVEAMATEGVTRDQLDDALGKLLDEVRAAGADDDTEEIINSVGDRLHGWCHESRQIKTIPTEEEIAKLTRWARVAFAARCTRRLLPLLALEPAASDTRQQVADVIRAIEHAAIEGSSEQMMEVWANALVAGKAFQDLNLNLQAAVADTAYRAALLAWGGGHLKVPEPGVIYKAMGPTAWGQTSVIASAVGVDVVRVIRRDYEMLMQSASEHHWEADTPVPASVFALPLWPHGVPSGWPQETDVRLDAVNSTDVVTRA